VAGERVFPAVNQVVGGGRILASPSSFYVTGEDRLRIVSYNVATGVVVGVHWRSSNAVGDTVPSRQFHIANSDRSAATDDYELGNGNLLNVTVFVTSGTPIMGQTFVKVQLVRGAGAAAIVLGTILQGYVTAAQAMGWPGSPIVNSVESGGFLREIQGTRPAAGAEIIETCPTGARWEILGMNITMTCSATAATRFTRIGFSNSGFVPAIVLGMYMSANETDNQIYAPNLPRVNANDQLSTGQFLAQFPLPGKPLLRSADFFRTFTDRIQAGDQWSAPSYLVREWLEP
jgi:hypothetical protein